jgi:hypothetical protein
VDSKIRQALTCGTSAQQRAQRQTLAESSGGARGAIIPGPVPLDLVAPVTDPIGARLLKLMGWRQGLADIARHGKGGHLTQDTRVEGALDDVAS